MVCGRQRGQVPDRRQGSIDGPRDREVADEDARRDAEGDSCVRRRVHEVEGELRGERDEQDPRRCVGGGAHTGGGEDEHRAERVRRLAEPAEHPFEPDSPLGELEDVAEHHPRGDAERHELEREAGRASGRRRAASRRPDPGRPRTRRCRRGHRRRRAPSTSERRGRRRGVVEEQQRRGDDEEDAAVGRARPELRGLRAAPCGAPGRPRSALGGGIELGRLLTKWVSERPKRARSLERGIRRSSRSFTPAGDCLPRAREDTANSAARQRERARSWELRARRRAFGSCW